MNSATITGQNRQKGGGRGIRELVSGGKWMHSGSKNKSNDVKYVDKAAFKDVIKL